MPPALSDRTAIRADGITHVFGDDDDARRVVALDDISIEVAKGELLCLIGPSGCGKSTLLNIMGGLVNPTQGQVQAGQVQVTQPLPDDIAFVFQESALFPWNTIVDNIKIAMKFQGVEEGLRDERAWNSLEAVGLADFGDHLSLPFHWPDFLSASATSGGM